MDYYKNKITYPIFKEGDTVKFSGENIDYNNPYSNLFTEKTFIIKNTPTHVHQLLSFFCQSV